MSDTDALIHEQQLNAARATWNAEAALFDDQPDHGLRDPAVRAAWADLLKVSLPASTAAVLDIGCGTGSLSLVLAGLGHAVVGIDLSPEMIALAQAKAAAAGHAIAFHVMDAAFPQLAPGQFDAIVCRHLMWALVEPDRVLERWLRLLKPGGRLLLIEGYWHTGAGLHASELLEMLPAALTQTTLQPLSDRVELWGGMVADERYAILARLPGQRADA